MSTLILILITLFIIIGILLITSRDNNKRISLDVESSTPTYTNLTIERLNEIFKEAYKDSNYVIYPPIRTFEDDEIDYPISNQTYND